MSAMSIHPDVAQPFALTSGKSQSSTHPCRSEKKLTKIYNPSRKRNLTRIGLLGAKEKVTSDVQPDYTNHADLLIAVIGK